MKGIEKYVTRINKIEEDIKKDLECLNPKNYKEELCRFGYESHEITDINAMLPKALKKNKEEMDKVKARINYCAPKNASGVYVFRVEGNSSFADKWKTYSADKKSPPLLEKNKKSPILYVGRDNDLRKRLLNHIYGLSKKKDNDHLHWQSTSGLKLSEFITQNPGFEFKVDFFYNISFVKIS